MRSFVLACALWAVSCGGSVSSSTSTEAGTDAGGDVTVVEAGEDGGTINPGGCPNCADESLLCDVGSGTCVECLTNADCIDQHGNENPNAVCLPDHTCGCTADSQCQGQSEGTRCVSSLQQCGCDSPADCPPSGGPACASNHQCGCGSNQDCAGDGGTAPPGYVCNTATGICVECVTDADCTDPDNRVCDGTTNLCLPCRTSADCAQNTDGPVCADFGQYSPGIGACGCTSDPDCVGHAGGPHCVSNGSPYDKCGCVTAADCASDPDGHACVNPYTDGWMQCGCTTTADCENGKTCSGYTCQ